MNRIVRAKQIATHCTYWYNEFIINPQEVRCVKSIYFNPLKHVRPMVQPVTQVLTNNKECKKRGYVIQHAIINKKFVSKYQLDRRFVEACGGIDKLNKTLDTLYSHLSCYDMKVLKRSIQPYSTPDFYTIYLDNVHYGEIKSSIYSLDYCLDPIQLIHHLTHNENYFIYIFIGPQTCVRYYDKTTK